MNKKKIYLGSLSYRMEGSAFPLGVGYIATMTNTYFPGEFETEIFIDPLSLEDSIKRQPPTILALANYSWNRNLNSQILRYAKRMSPSTLTVLGGPCFAKNDEKWMSDFFKINPSLNFYIAGEGEWKWVELIKQSIIYNCNPGIMHEHMPYDVFFLRDQIVCEGLTNLNHSDNDNQAKKVLENIPSPYLYGTMDTFLEDNRLVPMIETVRGCPYSCTFCCWGNPQLNGLTYFSVERVIEEINYISKRTKSKKLIMADGNFGILKRDLIVAEYLRKMSDSFGWPKNIYLYFDKNSGERVVHAASILGDLIKVSISRQTTNAEVLKNIKRTNIDDKTFSKIQEQLKTHSLESIVELLYPLPGETRQSFIDGLAGLIKQVDVAKTEIRFYPTELLPGSEMSTKAYREIFNIKSAWRKMPGFNRQLNSVGACEYQEIVVSTSTFSMADFFYVRKLHFFICLFSTYKIYHHIIKLLNKHTKYGLVYLIDVIINKIEMNDGILNDFLSEMVLEMKNEFISSEAYLSDEKYQQYQPNGNKRINIYYILKLLYGENAEYRYNFSKLLENILHTKLQLDLTSIIDSLVAIESNIVDFIQIEKWQINGSLTEKIKEIPHDPFVIEKFSKYFNGDLISTLDCVYDDTYAGHLDRVVLMKQ